MRRLLTDPRAGWRQTVEKQGLVFPMTELPDGGEVPYWHEAAYYSLTLSEVEYLEEVTERLHGMCLEAARFLATGAMGQLGLPPGSLEAARASLEADPVSIYGRFDLHWGGTGHARMLEYNADTPTGMVESAVAQWFWLQDVFPERDQWNSLHDRLVMAWRKAAPRLGSAPLYFAHHEGEVSGEEWMTVTYLQDTAEQAGLQTRAITIGDIGWDMAQQAFVDLQGQPIRACFKLYPWENMLAEPFGRYASAVDGPTTWVEPLWKVLLSNKALLAALWHLYPNDPNLLPAYLDGPGPLREWVAKPLHGREGDSIRIHADGVEHVQKGDYGAEGWCYQQWAPLPDFDGNKMVLGSWVVDGQAAGLGIRESDGWITDFYARFVPHVIATPRPSDEQVAAWLAEGQDGTPPPAPSTSPGSTTPTTTTSPSSTTPGATPAPADYPSDPLAAPDIRHDSTTEGTFL